ncbi:MAG TPA: glycine zipper 2TM domain-containing protein, partial [Novosphingobium sp.]|nr:glycine zipper 2TM domain-containing protein [Novosphingobium sp.]
VGAGLGALTGRAIDTRGERATGTILGAAAGALIGRELDRGPTRCR